jgi:hypothetical protein
LTFQETEHVSKSKQVKWKNARNHPHHEERRVQVGLAHVLGKMLGTGCIRAESDQTACKDELALEAGVGLKEYYQGASLT